MRLVTGACVDGSLPVSGAVVGQRARFQAAAAREPAGLVVGAARWRNQINRSWVMAIHKATANAFTKPRTRKRSQYENL